MLPAPTAASALPATRFPPESPQNSPTTNYRNQIGTDLESSSAAPPPIRLYISPFSPVLFPTIIPDSLRSRAAGVSYHSIVTFPEKAYGYVDLPVNDARHLRRKLHNTYLKGARMRVEEARPERGRKRKNDVAENEATSDGAKKSKKSSEKHLSEREGKHSRKGKKEDGVLPGVELPKGRHVKRGWLKEGAASKKDKKSKGTKSGVTTSDKDGENGIEDAQMSFRTSVPASKTDMVEEDQTKGKDKKKKKKSKTVEVKEFEHNTKHPSFLRDNKIDSESKPVSKFEDGKGWVDDRGNVIEQVSTRSTRKRSRQEAEKNDEPNPASTEDTTASKPPSMKKDRKKKKARIASSAKDSEKEEEAKSPSDAQDPPESSENKPKTQDNNTSQPPSSDSTRKEPSVLESLFKRPSAKAPRPSPIKTSFAFFPTPAPAANDADADADLETGHPVAEEPLAGGRRKTTTLTLPPSTPFTRRDLEDRGLRSAAPTPDTAAIGRRMRPPWGRSVSREADTDEDLDVLSRARGKGKGKGKSKLGGGGDVDVIEEEDGGKEDEEGGDDGEDGEVEIKQEEKDGETEFERHFYEKRGEYNRAWKVRRREARKGARQEARKGAGVRGTG